MATTKSKKVKGSNKEYLGSNSTSVIDVIKVYGNSNTVNARNGNDKIAVYKGKKHTIYGGAGTDTITIETTIGTGNNIYGDAGKDKINIKGGNSNYIYGGSGKDTITLTTGKKNYIYGQTGADTIKILGGSGNYIYGGSSGDKITVSGGTSQKVFGETGSDKIRIIGGSGQTVNTGTGNDSVYVEKGSVKSIVNAGGTDYIEIRKNAGNEIMVQSGTGDGKLVAKETVKVLGGNNHDIRLYGGNDKVIVAGGSGHVVYTDGPTGSGDTGDNDVIVIQSGGQAKRIVAGNGNDVIAIANGAGDGSTIYTGLENPNNVNTGTGINTVNILGGKDHIIYLGGTENKVLIEAQNVTLNKYAGTSDDIRVRWSEQGTGTLRINCPSVNSSTKSTLRLEGVESYQVEFYKQSVDIYNENGYKSETVDALVLKFVGQYNRDTRTISGNYQWNGDNEGNTRLPVYVNGNGLIQYNWCAGNQQISYNPTPVATGGSIEITRWFVPSLRVFDSITFDDKSVGYADIITASGKTNHSLYNG